MVWRCTIEGCGNESQKDAGISLFKIPFDEIHGEIEEERRRQWIVFIAHGKYRGWKPSKSTRVCSLHFTPDSLEKRYDGKRYKLISDDIGILAVPTVRDYRNLPSARPMSPTTRAKRVQAILDEFYASQSHTELPEVEELNDIQPAVHAVTTKDCSVETSEPEVCKGCAELLTETCELKNQILDYQLQADSQQKTIQSLLTRLKTSQSELTSEPKSEHIQDQLPENKEARETMEEGYHALDLSFEVKPGAEGGSEYIPAPKKAKVQRVIDRLWDRRRK